MKFRILIGISKKNALFPVPEIDNCQIDWLPESLDRAAFLELISNYDAFLVYGHKANTTFFEKASRLKIISKHGVGYDNIDVAAAKAKGVVVANTPKGPLIPTADLAMGLILSTTRRIAEADRNIRRGINQFEKVDIFATTLTGKKLGILGMGRIGKALAKRAAAFDMEIYYHNRNPLNEYEEIRYQAKYLDLDTLLKEIDVLSIHTPLNAQTTNLIDETALAKMKSTAFIINTSRGKVIDQEALIKALQERKIAGAGLDVFAEEPKVPPAFLDMPNVVLTPHIGSATFEDREAMFNEALGNILAFFRGEEVENKIE